MSRDQREALRRIASETPVLSGLKHSVRTGLAHPVDELSRRQVERVQRLNLDVLLTK